MSKRKAAQSLFLIKKLYCLVVMDDYSRFTWVFFLVTKDETSGILKSIITRIENLVDHKVKVIRYDNETEFKNREINQFCEMKGILRQFSVARTPQQNRVSEKRNKILIEAARTKLADTKLPTTFWAETINTTCYVQNSVLVVKPHNNTPCELFHSRTPTLSFMRPFRCLVTIFNTIDHLGKFDSKVDKGFFVGYSLNSKTFRVFNSRTRIVEENLHIRFSKSTPNVVDEVIHKELGDNLVRAATTASSLEAEHDSSNINKTQSKATPNERSSHRTNSGSGPRFQEAIGDTTAQTRFEIVSKHSNDSLLAKGNILQSDEDRLELNELMALCTNLQTRVLDLEKTKATQRLRIDAIYQNEDITLVNVQDDAEMFDVDDLGGEELFVAKQEVVSIAATIVTSKELTLAQALKDMKTSKPKVKRIVIQEQEETCILTTTTIYKQESQDKGKGIMIEEPVKPKKKA
nr:hypothetical protein [Tanacetum cinerariifolium]